MTTAPLTAIDESPPSPRQPKLPTPAESLTSFQLLGESFAGARDRCPAEYVEQSYLLAGRRVTVRIVGRALAAAYQRAFAPHLLTAPRDAPNDAQSGAPTGATLTIDLWDETVSGAPYPLPLAVDDGEWGAQATERQLQLSDSGGQRVWSVQPGSASWLDRTSHHMAGWRSDGAHLPTHERSKPLNFLLPLWFYDQGIHILHAGMVAHAGRGVLIAGGSGIGKTTTTLCCVQAGLDYLSDDQVAVARAGAADAPAGAYVARSLFQSARILPDHLQRFPRLQPHASLSHDPQDPKALLFLAEIFPQQVVAQAPINAIALPRLSGQAQTSVQAATRADALNYMARTSLLTPFGVGRARFVELTRLLGSVPCYWLNLGYDLTTIPPTIETILAADC